MKYSLLLVALISVISFSVDTNGFSIGPTATSKTVTQRRTTNLFASPKYSMPSQQESEQLGIREWPQQTKSSTWEDQASEGQTLVRYILQGSGTLYVDGSSSKRFNTGILVEVDGPVTLKWEKDDGEDVILLTPGFENAGLFAGALVGFVAMVGALLALS